MAHAGYPLGFIVAPIYMHDGWEEGYFELFERLNTNLQGIDLTDLTFELIQHRFTKPAKTVIQNDIRKRSSILTKRNENINGDDTASGNMCIRMKRRIG